MFNRQNIILIIIALMVWGGVALAAYNTIVASSGLTFDFYPRYVGGRAIWNQTDPYTDEITQEIQMGMFGRLVPVEADQQRFAYPAYVGIIIAPFLILPPTQALAAWTSLQLVSIIISTLLMLPLLKWRPLPFILFFIVFGMVFMFRHPINTFVLGQFTGVMLLLLVGGLLCLIHEKDVWAGVLFALAVNPPTIAGPLTMGILGVYVLGGRWKGALAYVMTLALLTLVSILLIGWWIPDFVANLSDYSDYAKPVWVLNALPNLLAYPFVIAMAALLGWFVRRLLADFSVDNQIDLFMLASILCLLILPQTGAYYMVLLIPPMIVALYRADKIQYRMRWAIRGAVTLIVLSVWWFFFTWGEQSLPEAIGLPMSVLIIYLVARHFVARNFALRKR